MSITTYRESSSGGEFSSLTGIGVVLEQTGCALPWGSAQPRGSSDISLLTLQDHPVGKPT
ncbi:MAG TPA: hypothetical protein VFH80_25600 [Solirubrobacteraceae bacterium]|nr:hypothetical protein [Solirubrobacteraceae bacterium]